MADLMKGFQVILLLLYVFAPCSYAKLPTKCEITVGKVKYSITNWTWKVVEGKTAYYINMCGQVAQSCSKFKDCSVCSTSLDDTANSGENLGIYSSGNRVLNNTVGAAGFSAKYTGGVCSGRGSGPKKWNTTIFLRCGKFLGSPQFVDITVSAKTCVAVFEFITNEACKTPSTVPEMPCSLYDREKKLRDLTPLIKLNGGYKVASSIPNFDFYINVCRGIIPKSTGDTQSCPTNSSVCRVDNQHAKKEDVGNIIFASKFNFSSTNDIILVYNTTKKVSGCLHPPVTTVTFKCPREMAGDGPVLTAARDCRYEVLWETTFACPQANIMSTSGCVLVNEFVNFNLTKLTAAKLENYKINYDVVEKGKKTHYLIYMNVCKSLGFACGPGATNSTVCQENKDGAKRYSLGDLSKQTLRFADRHLTLTYEHGDKCSSGLNRTTIILFICDYQVDKGQPVFNSESYCFYYFDWRTKYACPPSRRTGTRCRVESHAGLRYDLSELVRMERESNWIALDGESSSSDKQIFINVCGQLTFRNQTQRCNRAAAICMFEKSTGKVFSLGRYTDPPTLNQDNSIKLVYTQGSECKKDNLERSVRIKSTITFVCQPGDLESPPVLVTHSQDNCHYQFMWKSAAACSLGLNRGQDCKVEDVDAGYVFDLSPLARHTWDKKDFYTVVDQSQYTFELKVCGGSNQTGCTGSNIAACQIKTANPKFNFTIGQPNSMLYYYDGMLNLTYVSRGKPCSNGINRTTHITFLCDHNAVDNGVGKPIYEKEDHCVYNFRWFTKYACLSKITECIARSDSDQYDLTSLVRTKDNWQAKGGGGTFYINVCRMLNLDSDVYGCSGTSAVCLQKDDGTSVNLGSVNDKPHVEGEGITITYTNGDKCVSQAGKLYQSKITFICKTGLTSSSPKFDEFEDSSCTYKFRWETAAACKIVNVVGTNCAVKDPKSDTTFNLLPLMKGQNKAVYSGNLTDNEGKGKFELNICGKVPGCRKKVENVGACLTTSNGTKIVLGKSNKKLEYMGEILTLVYREGDNFEATGEQREVHIKFYCNPKVPFGTPAFVSQQGNKYFFDLQTSLVCSASAVQCMVTGKGNLTYDLTPLGLTNGNWEAVDTRPQDKHLHYFINICRSLSQSVDGNQELLKCPGGAIGACQIDRKHDKGFNLGYVQSNPQIADNGELSLQYSGGSECHHQYNRSIRIVFSCSKQMGSPIFLAESPECEYLFSWQTPSACALTREQGDNCTVEDKQYGYMFNLSKLYNETGDYDVSVSGAPGVRIVLNVCNKLVGNLKECHEPAGSVGACIISADGKPKLVAPSNHLIYFNGQINMTYGRSPSPSINFIFECDQDATKLKTGPSCEKKSDSSYECHWPTSLACRPMINVQCSIRNEDGSVDDQYDFSPLSMSTRNWQARVTDPHFDGAYFINVCRTVLLKGSARLCSPTAGVCMIQGGKAYNLGTIKRGPVKEGINIYLKYEDGDNCGSNGKRYSSRIHMECGSTEAEPVFVRKSKETCLYEFLWITSSACPVNTKSEVVFNNCTAINPVTRVLFDLNSLRGKEDYVVKDKENRTYQLNVCGPLVKPPKSCDPKSSVCQLGQVTFNAGMANSRLHFDDGVLYLNLSGGDECHHVKKKRETIISFVCSSSYGKQDFGKPVFISENDCTYYITWHTSLVCERQYECAAVKRDGSVSHMYSLGRLIRSDANWLVTNEEGTDDHRTYYVNLCRPLVAMPGTNCPAGAWACRIENGRAVNLGYATDPPVVAGKGEVRLIYKSTTKCKEDQSKHLEVHFTFICRYGSLGHPVLQPKGKCAVHIRWLTSAACGEEQKAELDKCRVYDNGTGEYYNLNALSRASQDIKYSTVGKESAPPYFLVSVCHGLSLSNAGNCDGAGVCLVKKTDVYTALGLFKFKSMTYYKDEGMLILKYCSKDCNTRGIIISRIIFVCDKNQSSVGKPELDTYGKYGADFTWRTSVVCPPLEEQCSFSDGNKNYDLRLLSSRTRSWHYVHNKDRFWINICRGITDGPTGCPSTASVCMIRKGSKKVNILGVTSTQMMSVNDGNLHLAYSGLPPIEGCSQEKNSKVVFYFVCGNNVGQPQFEREEWSSCSFIIKWKSSVACQLERKKLDEANCVVKHPVTGMRIDFNKLGGSTRSIYGMDEDSNNVSYAINVCGKLSNDLASDCKGQEAVCWKGTALDVTSRTFYYEGSIFSLEMNTKENCANAKDSTAVVVINFQCSVGEGVGSPKFDYVSSNCHYFFSWPTSIVCSDDLTHEVTDIPAAHKALKSPTKTNVGIALGVVFAVILVVAFAIVLYKPSRRHSIISCLRWNFKRHVLRREIKFPVYRYQKLDSMEDDEADSLIKEADGSDDDEENEDDDLLPF